MKLLLALLCGFFRIGVDEPTPDADAPPAADAPPPADDVQGDLLADVDGAPPAGDDKGDAPPKIDPAVEEARRSAEEARARADRAEREAADLRAAQQRQNSDEARLRADEDRVLADPQADANEKWRIQANRRIRSTEQTAATLAFQSQDTNDRSNFSIACAENKRLAFVREQVESELQKMRQNGQNAARESIAYYLLGKMAATAKPKGQSKAAPAKAGPRGGATNGVRSDVGKQGVSEREKRRARLENVNI